MRTLVFVGCNSSDDAVRLARQHGKSFLFEPLPEAAAELRVKVAGISGVEVLQAACGVTESVSVLNVYNRKGLSSSLGEVTQQARDRFPTSDLSLTQRVRVNVCNLGEFLESRGVKEIETMIIDAQGMDLAIVKTIAKWLAAGLIRVLQVEADGDGFQHYMGVPENTVDSHLRFMGQFPKYKQKPTKTFSWHPDLRWELERADTVEERLERMACRSYA